MGPPRGTIQVSGDVHPPLAALNSQFHSSQSKLTVKASGVSCAQRWWKEKEILFISAKVCRMW